MGTNICFCQQQVSNLEMKCQKFRNSIQYYDTDFDPISKQKIRVYHFQKNYIQKRIFQLETKQQLQRLSNFIFIFHKSPTAVQTIYNFSSEKAISCTRFNYQLTVFSEHLTFSLRDYLKNLKYKNLSLSTKEIFYIMRQLILISAYLVKKKLRIRSFNANQIYLNTNFEIQIPYYHIIDNIHEPEANSAFLEQLPVEPTQYPSPEEFDYFNLHHLDREYLQEKPQISSIFSLAILIMECVTMLDSIVSYYRLDKQYIDMKKLRQDIEQIENKQLAFIISKMTEKEMQKRIKFYQLQQIILKMPDDQFQKYLAYC